MLALITLAAALGNPTEPLGMPNKEYTLATVMKNLSEQHGYCCSTYSNGWIIAIDRLGVTQYIYGYNFPLNNATSARICGDKAAASSILESNGIKCIPHHIILNPNLTGWAPEGGAWQDIQTIFENYHHNIVCKPKEGTGGEEIFHARSPRELEIAVQFLFNKYRDLVISPFEEIGYEYRAIVLNGQVELLFRKYPPFVTGDGRRNMVELFADYLNDLKRKDPNRAAIISRYINPALFNWNEIPLAGKTVKLHWKHNLGQGASCEVIGGASVIEENLSLKVNVDQKKIDQLTNLALTVSKTLNITFASVDIAELENGEITVLEINAGVMMDNLISQYGENGKRVAYRIYDKALRMMF